jgi:DNA-binding CsgD family transcriptional regulator
MGVGSDRLEQALQATVEWQAAATIGEFARQVCATLDRLIRSDGVGWNEVDMTGRTLRALTYPAGYFVTGHDRLAQLIDENPLVEHRTTTRGAAHTFSDFLTVREFHRRQMYVDVYRDQGVEDQLAGMVGVSGGTLIAVAMNRSTRSFTQSDRRLLDLLRPQLARSYRTVVERAEARRLLGGLERGLEAADLAVAMLAKDGRISEATVEAQRLVAGWFGHVPPAPGRYLRPDAEVVVRRIEGDPPLLVMHERRLAPDPERARELGLTRREVEVVLLAGRGLANAQIAGELVVSPRTVQKHLEHAYAKLGVHTRVGAARMLIGDHSPHQPSDDAEPGPPSMATSRPPQP